MGPLRDQQVPRKGRQPLPGAAAAMKGSRSIEADPQAERPAEQGATVPALATSEGVPIAFAPTPPETSPPQTAPSFSISTIPMEHGWQPFADEPKTHGGDAAAQTKKVQKLECL